MFICLFVYMNFVRTMNKWVSLNIWASRIKRWILWSGNSYQ